MAILLQDDFNRADSTTSPGAPAVGGPWAPTSGTWGINSGQLYLSNAASPAHYLLAPAAANVDFQWTQVTPIQGGSNPQGGGVIRAIDNANSIYMARVSTGTFAFFQTTAGASVQISPEFASTANQVMRLVAYGEQIWFYSNGALAATFADPRYEPGTRNKVGFRNGFSTTSRWDDVIASTVDAHPFGITGEANDVELVLADASVAWTPSLYKGRDSALQDESEIP